MQERKNGEVMAMMEQGMDTKKISVRWWWLYLVCVEESGKRRQDSNKGMEGKERRSARKRLVGRRIEIILRDIRQLKSKN